VKEMNNMSKKKCDCWYGVSLTKSLHTYKICLTGKKILLLLFSNTALNVGGNYE